MNAPERRFSPVALVLGASVLSGATGYLVTILVARQIGETAYSGFAVFWSALYLVIGALGGVQQEVTRATSAAVPRGRGARSLVLFALLSAAIVLVVIIAAAALGSALFGSDAAAQGVVLAVGAASYVLVAALAGALYGVSAWFSVASLIAIDGIVRLIAVVLVLATDPTLPALFVAVVLPFPIAVAVVLPIAAMRHRGAVQTDAAPRRLAWNVARTIAASAATASIISGFPFLLGITAANDPAERVGALVLALTLVRAPIVIPLMSLQSYLIVHFGSRPEAAAARAVRLAALVLLGSAALGVVAGLVGPWLLSVVVGAGFVVDGTLLFVLVASSGLIAAMCVTGPALIALSRHTALAAGWGVAAVATLLLLLLPLPLEWRVCVALVFGPVAGLLVHVIGLRSSTQAGPKLA